MQEVLITKSHQYIADNNPDSLITLQQEEREIAIKIQENQMKQNGMLGTDKVQQENTLSKETPVIQMNPKENTPLQAAMAKISGATVNGSDHYVQNHLEQPRMKRSSRLRL